MIEEMEIKMRNLLQEVGLLRVVIFTLPMLYPPSHRSISVKPVILCTTCGVWMISQRPGNNESYRRSWLGSLSGDVRVCNARRLLKRYFVVVINVNFVSWNSLARETRSYQRGSNQEHRKNQNRSFADDRYNKYAAGTKFK
jgi:hypothetical protein